MAFPTNQSVTFAGQQNNANDNRKLFLDIFAGEVLTEFHNKNIMMDKHRVRTISSGKSASFPMIGTAGAKYHTPGELIQADQIAHSERKVTVDDLLISPIFIPNIQEAMRHYEVRSTYSSECAYALAAVADRNILRTALKSAFITNATQAAAAGLVPVTGETFTTNVALGAADDENKGDKIVASVFAAVEQMQTKNVTGEMALFLRPAQYYALFNTTDTSKLFYMNKDVGGAGSYATAQIPMIAGVPVYLTNNLPSSDQQQTTVAGATVNNLSDGDPSPLADTAVGSGRDGAYAGDYSDVVGLLMNKDAVATVKLMDLGLESEYQIDRQGTLMVAKYAMGHNILRPAGAIAITKFVAAG
jgi:hypothetical protein